MLALKECMTSWWDNGVYGRADAAQEQVDDYFRKMDTDKDGFISMKELW